MKNAIAMLTELEKQRRDSVAARVGSASSPTSAGAWGSAQGRGSAQGPGSAQTRGSAQGGSVSSPRSQTEKKGKKLKKDEKKKAAAPVVSQQQEQTHQVVQGYTRRFAYIMSHMFLLPLQHRDWFLVFLVASVLGVLSLLHLGGFFVGCTGTSAIGGYLFIVASDACCAVCPDHYLRSRGSSRRRRTYSNRTITSCEADLQSMGPHTRESYSVSIAFSSICNVIWYPLLICAFVLAGMRLWRLRYPPEPDSYGYGEDSLYSAEAVANRRQHIDQGGTVPELRGMAQDDDSHLLNGHRKPVASVEESRPGRCPCMFEKDAADSPATANASSSSTFGAVCGKIVGVFFIFLYALYAAVLGLAVLSGPLLLPISRFLQLGVASDLLDSSCPSTTNSTIAQACTDIIHTHGSDLQCSAAVGIVFAVISSVLLLLMMDKCWRLASPYDRPFFFRWCGCSNLVCCFGREIYVK